MYISFGVLQILAVGLTDEGKDMLSCKPLTFESPKVLFTPYSFCLVTFPLDMHLKTSLLIRFIFIKLLKIISNL